MGRKGGGQKGFMKSVKKAAAQPEEADPESVAPAPEETTETKTMSDLPTSSDQQPTEVAAPLPKAESKSQLRDRHKKEQQALKKKCAQLGKKKKDEAAQLMQELKERQEKELAEFVAPVDSDNEETGGETGAAQGSGNAEPTPDATMSLYGSSAGGKSAKMGKSQKRREKAAQKEADRDARIAKEHADLGESERCVEERTLNTKLEPLGLRMYDIKADGHCLYRAVNHQLRDSSATDNSYEELRKLAAEYMRNHKDDFQPFFAMDVEGNLETAFEEHCEKVEGTAEWGGEMELRALSHALERAIVVHSVDLPDTTLGEHNLSKKDPLRVCFMRHAYRLGNHYNSVEPVEASN
ncbi:hypothetical protein BSKO_00172 [Bryopsis sp. KO-2023]|nr:hypothetical protein BSKO_00172 [Bryopsis sp. KO-2023]